MPLRRVELFLSAGSCLKARREAERLLAEGGLSPRDQGRAHRLACRASLALQEPFAAVRSGERAAEAAAAAGDTVTLSQVHLDLGCAFTEIGDAHLAETHLNAFLSLLPQGAGPSEGPGQNEGVAHHHLGRVYRQRKEWPRAVTAFEQALPLVAPGLRAGLGLNLAWCHLMMGRPDRADPHLSAVSSYLTEHPDDRLSADLLSHRALCFRLRGELAASTALCQELFTPGRRGAGDPVLAVAAWVTGENALDLGRPAEAILFVNLALDHAVKANRPDLMNLAGDLRRRIAAATHQ